MTQREQSSSVVIRGLDATTFEQMEDFVDDLQQRPLDRLLRDLPRLARLSSTKFALVSYVMKRKFEGADATERERIRDQVTSVTSTEPEPDPRERLERLLERLA
jgi:hypothetical protein